MSDTFEIEATARADKGKGSSRRLRRLADHIPAIIYGGETEPQPLTLIRKDLEKALENEAFYSHVLAISIDGKSEKAILKDLQRHPANNLVMHADFMRINVNVKIKVNVQIHFINETECYGVKTEGGMVQHQATDVEVLCLPGDIPEYLEVDMLDVKVGDIIHLTDIKLPEGVESTALSLGEDHDLAIASVLAPKGNTEEEEEAAAAEAAEADGAEADGDKEGDSED
ncbi:50S ribosomal protein L25/general stress protein Ctc [Halieaceae bacterium IMCC14734]|uniref:Large ribosomal subunit protein bL25 n=1 Tax=Candidatus Litorirhabdus singularis TaxID=2518993 RepID=A0ABT3TMD1_9GAMM|nr:50S ribosomal protein L25/general stress protein Ctc [Candidatus Litorirhabdus singularis]MCX2982487.1 50S ribosomal protein L25/general stress protein Ctc [Candidatus Litorirhabdus singularis]